ncbi:uncharacterized protein PGTG_09172 [Puccinia graminis f. sp. tritici CRL 75-36-700-3]|uniref:Uncharacterized protein n=1 Tax=Puccinia graminis f. sp. tritici (strain CRL 75-36-700-3 / race SCCL) TaxID=418459 RepID=E3KFT4_PUCGT|nr:uncharacterized protein PGTG_09172 [Puccinia graminis f. sp. tritici CRL 75-36-700-3]EFP83219.2 hypothetical protein PGTG_09172 [Puccinia graminis f. sp. tritici CRL 75-36-700-3]
MALVHPHNPQLVMDVLMKDLSDWAEAMVANAPEVSAQLPPNSVKFLWVDRQKRPTPHPLEAPPGKRNTGPDFTTPPNRPTPASENHPPSEVSEDDDIEVIPISSGATNHATPAASSIPTQPVPPASPELESHDMETYLHVAHIPPNDKLTRAQLLTHGIVHWSFFRASSENELIGLGFPIGIARLLIEGAIEGAGRLARYDHNEGAYTGGMTPSPSPVV